MLFAAVALVLHIYSFLIIPGLWLQKMALFVAVALVSHIYSFIIIPGL